jgi:hypothetical protein
MLMKKIFISLVSLLFVSIAAWGEVLKVTVDDIAYKIDTDALTAEVTYPNASKPGDGDGEESSYTGAITIPASITVEETDYTVTEIGERAFYRAAITSISLPEGLLTIGKKALYKSKITTLIVPNSVSKLGDECVEKCSELSTITLGSNIANNKWGAWVFWRSSGAYDVYMICDTKPELYDNQTFDDSHASTIHVPAAVYDEYVADAKWNIYTIITELGVVDGIKYLKDSRGNAYVTYPNATKPSSENPNLYSGNIVIPSKITHGGYTYNVIGIADYAFRNASITSLKLPEGLLSIGEEAIYQTNITELTIPNSVTTLGQYSLAYNSALTTVTFGKNVDANSWGAWVLYRESGAYDVYMNCDTKPSVPDKYTFDHSYGTTIHVWPDLLSSYTGSSKWNVYNVVGDLGYSYSDLTSAITEYENVIDNEVGTDPGYYVASSTTALSDAIDAAKDLTMSATNQEIYNAICDMKAAAGAMDVNPLTEGYYYIEDVYNGLYMRSDRNNKDDGGIRAKTLNTSDQRFYFKLTREGGNWIVQCVDDNNNVWHIGGPKSYKNENDRCLTITENPLKEQVISWVSGGKFKIQSLYDGTHTSYPYCVSTIWTDYACIYNYAIGSADEDRMYWHFHPASTTDSFKGILSASEVKDKIDNAAGTYLDLSKYAMVVTDLTSNMPVSSNLLVKVKSGSSITGTNIINNGVCESLVLTDGQPFGYTADFTATAASYERTVANTFGTICLPYAVSSNEDVQYYTLNRVSGTTLYLTAQDEIEAGVPAVFEMLKGGTTLTANAASASVVGSVPAAVNPQLIGTFNTVVITGDDLENSYYISKDKFYQASNSITVNPFRAYFTYTAPSSVKMFNLSVEEEETAIERLVPTLSEGEGVVYNLSGQRLNKMQKGINIVNGKKVLF